MTISEDDEPAPIAVSPPYRSPGLQYGPDVWAPPPMYPRAPSSSLGTASRVMIGLFTAILVFVTVGVVTDNTRMIPGNALEAPDAAAAARTNTAEGSGKTGKVYELSTNPLLASSNQLAKVTCHLPALGRSDAELKAFYEAQVICLDKAWQPVLQKVHEPESAALVAVKVPAVSRCGDAPDSKKALAYYCPGDSTIYAPSDWMLDAVGLNKGSHLATIAHEYGHHVQNESGILNAASDQMTSDDESSPADLERVRRIELQANCFGALFIAAAAGRGDISAASANAAIADYGNTSDSDSHGSRKHQLGWARAGFEQKNTAACDTWSASAADVT
jgi:predicted metalloprotease